MTQRMGFRDTFKCTVKRKGILLYVLPSHTEEATISFWWGIVENDTVRGRPVNVLKFKRALPYEGIWEELTR